MKSLVLFRLETTLLHERALRSLALSEVLAERNIVPHPALIEATHSMPTAVALRIFLGPNDTDLPFLHRRLERRLVQAYARFDDALEVFGASRALERLRSMGYAVGIDSGFTRPVLDVLLERLGWIARGLVRTTVASDEADESLGGAIFYAASAGRVCDARQVIRVGAAAWDLLSAAEAGCALRIGVGREHRLDGWPYTHSVPTATLVPELLRRIELAAGVPAARSLDASA